MICCCSGLWRHPTPRQNLNRCRNDRSTTRRSIFIATWYKYKEHKELGTMYTGLDTWYKLSIMRGISLCSQLTCKAATATLPAGSYCRKSVITGSLTQQSEEGVLSFAISTVDLVIGVLNDPWVRLYFLNIFYYFSESTVYPSQPPFCIRLAKKSKKSKYHLNLASFLQAHITLRKTEGSDHFYQEQIHADTDVDSSLAKGCSRSYNM